MREHPAAAQWWGTNLIGGAGAGIVAALAGLAVEIAMSANLPPRVPTAWSAFVAGILGGLLYAALHRITRRPVLTLWIITLGIATIDSLLIATLPFPAGPGPRIGVPVWGLIVPLQQLAALVGIGRLGEHHYPAASLPAATIVHYVTAVTVSLLVPWWADRKRP